MLQYILGFYLQGLLIAAIVVILLGLIWFMIRASKGVDQTLQERHDFLFDLLMITVMTIPIVAFGVVSIILMIKV